MELRGIPLILLPWRVMEGYFAWHVESQKGSAFVWDTGKDAGQSTRFPALAGAAEEILSGKGVQSMAWGTDPDGLDHMACITASDELYTWGSGKHGQLGLGDETDKNRPTLVAALQGFKIKQVACGSNHTAALTQVGEVYTWGWDKFGQLGHNQEPVQTLPRLVAELEGKEVRQIACSDTFSAAVLATGEVYTWGSGEFGRLGVGENPKEHKMQRTPRLVQGLQGKGVQAVSLGKYHAAALTSVGQVWTWGYAKYGQLGHGNDAPQINPTLVTALVDEGKTVVQVVCGAYHTLALTDAGEVYAWGSGGYGQLGLGHRGKQTVPKLVESLSPEGVMEICCGEHHSCALTRSSKLLVWGKAYGFLAATGEPDLTSPTDIGGNIGEPLLHVVCGDTQLCALTLYGEPRPAVEAGAGVTPAAQAERPIPTGNDLEAEIARVKLQLEQVQAEESVMLKEEEAKRKDILAEVQNLEAELSKAKREAAILQLNPSEKRLIDQVMDLRDKLNQTLLSKLNPKHHLDFRRLLALSNESIDQIRLQSQKLSQGDDNVDLRRLVSDLLTENADLRRKLNEFTEGIMKRTVERVEQAQRRIESDPEYVQRQDYYGSDRARGCFG